MGGPPAEAHQGKLEAQFAECKSASTKTWLCHRSRERTRTPRLTGKTTRRKGQEVRSEAAKN